MNRVGRIEKIKGYESLGCGAKFAEQKENEGLRKTAFLTHHGRRKNSPNDVNPLATCEKGNRKGLTIKSRGGYVRRKHAAALRESTTSVKD